MHMWLFHINEPKACDLSGQLPLGERWSTYADPVRLLHKIRNVCLALVKANSEVCSLNLLSTTKYV
jgi:hypothetical protein